MLSKSEKYYISRATLSNKEIAEERKVSIRGVERGFEYACVKLNAKNRTQALIKALKLGLIKLEDVVIN